MTSQVTATFFSAWSWRADKESGAQQVMTVIGYCALCSRENSFLFRHDVNERNQWPGRHLLSFDSAFFKDKIFSFFFGLWIIKRRGNCAPTKNGFSRNHIFLRLINNRPSLVSRLNANHFLCAFSFSSLPKKKINFHSFKKKGHENSLFKWPWMRNKEKYDENSRKRETGENVSSSRTPFIGWMKFFY